MDALEIVIKHMGIAACPECMTPEERLCPDTWFHQLDYIFQHMKNINPAYEKKDMEVKTFILAQLPEVYSEVVTN